jgi:hypothetical protein
MNFPGKLWRDDRLVLDPVGGTIRGQTKPAGASSWSCNFSLPAGRYLPGGSYVSQLEDGQSGNIVLASVASGFDGPSRRGASTHPRPRFHSSTRSAACFQPSLVAVGWSPGKAAWKPWAMAVP